MNKFILIMVCFFTSLTGMDFNISEFEQLLLRYEDELYGATRSYAPLFNADLAIPGEDAYRPVQVKARMLKQYYNCDTCGVLIKDRHALKRHEEFCNMPSAEHLTHTEQLGTRLILIRQQNRSLELQALYAAADHPVINFKKKSIKSLFICKFCNDESKSLCAFKKHLCFNHNILDVDVRPFQKPSPIPTLDK